MKNFLSKFKNASYTERLCMIMVFLFILSLIPLLHLSLYAHPWADDYTYGVKAHLAWEHSRSLWATLQAALENTRDFYESWQGTYSSIIMMSIQPAVISERLYPLTTVLMLGMLIGSHFFMFRILFTKYVKLSKNLRIVITLSVLFLSIQILDDAGQAFFWYNGSVHYVFMHSCMIFLLGFILLLLTPQTKLLRAVSFIAACFLAIVTGGANFITALLTPVLIALLLFLCLLKKKKAGFLLLPPFLLSVFGLLISVSAPGNAVRMTQQAAPMGAMEAIYQSFLYAVRGIGDWTTLYLILVLTLITPLLFTALYQSDSSFRFPLPGCVAAISFCIIAVTYTPSLYSMGHVVVYDRTLNIMRMTYYVLCILNLLYFLGWFAAKLHQADSEALGLQIIHKIRATSKTGFTLFISLGFLALLVFSDKNEVTTLSAMHSLKEGYAQSYHQESLHRISLLSAEGVDEVWIPNFSVKPPLLYLEDISTDPTNWRNNAMAKWYEKEIVHLSVIY